MKLNDRFSEFEYFWKLECVFCVVFEKFEIQKCFKTAFKKLKTA